MKINFPNDGNHTDRPIAQTQQQGQAGHSAGLWEDIADEQATQTVPEKHLRIVAERMAKVDAGTSESRPWSEIRMKYLS
ncbi:MAG: addiction module protein [Flavobacteriales bacterium]|nr:addiction module protein [Flavobacteriales bacterium]